MRVSFVFVDVACLCGVFGFVYADVGFACFGLAFLRLAVCWLYAFVVKLYVCGICLHVC